MTGIWLAGIGAHGRYAGGAEVSTRAVGDPMDCDHLGFLIDIGE